MNDNNEQNTCITKLDIYLELCLLLLFTAALILHVSNENALFSGIIGVCTGVQFLKLIVFVSMRPQLLD